MELFDELNREMKATRASSAAFHVSTGEPTRPLAGPLQFVAATRASSPAIISQPPTPNPPTPASPSQLATPRPLSPLPVLGPGSPLEVGPPSPLEIVKDFGYQGKVWRTIEQLIENGSPTAMLIIQPTSSGKGAYARELARRPGKV